MRPSKRLAMRTYLESVDLDTILNSADNCEGKTLLLEQIIKTGFDHVMPMRTRKVHSTEPPWITSSFQNLLQKRQSAKSLKHLHEGIDQIGLANIINEAFLSPMHCFTPLSTASPYTTFCNYTENPLVVSVDSVRKKLSKLNLCKANGPDSIPGWLLKEHADILAGPVSDILNYSYREGRPRWNRLTEKWG